MEKKVFVSGCFDLLHSGHVAFFEEAASYGDLYVGLGSDKTIVELKGRPPVNPQEERLYIVNALKVVKEVRINRGNGILDFYDYLVELKPDILFVNEDGNSEEKELLCKKLNIQYVVSERIPKSNLPARSTTELKKRVSIPFRIDLAGGWLDQPYVSKYYPGPVITISIEPDYAFNDRSGMSSSTRKKAIELWGTKIPEDNREKLAKVLFCYENPPGSKYISGSQDALGIVMPGLNYLYYKEGEYWPEKIKTEKQEEILSWLENHIRLLALTPRDFSYNVLEGTSIDKEGAQMLSVSAEGFWDAVLDKDAIDAGNKMTASFEAQVRMFPNMINDDILKQIERIKTSVLGYKLSGAGGGGYIVLFTDKEIPNTLRINIRR